jgi:putative ABC transport system permease protein
MGSFAWRNLMTRPLRTTLALVGLSVPILGVMGLFSLSGGLRNLVGDTLSKIQGVMVLRENVPSPVFSDLPADLAPKLARIPGVASVAPEVWKIAPTLEGVSVFSRTLSGAARGKSFQGILDTPVIQGQDIVAHSRLKSAVYPRALLKGKEGGRYLVPEDRGKPHVVISKKIANDFRDAQGRPKKVGDTLKIMGEPFTIIGIYETGTMFLDVVLIMDINVARRVLGVAPDTVSSFYVEMVDPSRNDEIARQIEESFETVDARSMSEFMANFGMLMGQLDKFLLMTVSLALLVGVVGIINTMLMSTTERFVEFGVLRTNGWSQGNVLALVTAESAFLGLLSGIVGCTLALAGVEAANQFLSGGLRLVLPPWLFALGIGLSVVTGTLGGLYPAWRAARLVPMDAIRVGSH